MSATNSHDASVWDFATTTNGTRRMALPRTRALVEQYLSKVRRAQDSAATGDPVERLRSLVSNRPWVLFAGAGLSCEPPAAAPTFAHLRNAAGVAVSQRLVEMGLLSVADAAAIEKGFIEVDRRSDISLPPEKLFSDVGEALGNDFVHSLLMHSLSTGAPNLNHRAIAALARGSLEAVITPNFDEYVEAALSGAPPHRIVGTTDVGGSGLRLYKPHGSLDNPNEILISVFDMARPLEGRAREIFRTFVENRLVVVFGYSGQDRDLFPLLLHAGREWSTEIAWLLFDDGSRNEPVAALQVSLGDRCTLIDTAKRPILAELAGIERVPAAAVADQSLTQLARLVKDDLKPKRPEDLIVALISNIIPADVAGGEAIVTHLADVLLGIVPSMFNKDPKAVLSYVGEALAYLPSGPRREAAKRMGLGLATRWGSPVAIRAWSTIVAGEDRDDSAENRLRNVVRELEELPHYPADIMRDGARIKKSMEVGLRIQRACLLWDTGREDEAERETRQLITEAPWPKSSMDSEVAASGDACAPWQLYVALACFEAKQNRLSLADQHILVALELLWREPDLWTLGDVLCSRVSTLAQRVGDDKLQEFALELALGLARLSNDRNSEATTLKWCFSRLSRRRSP